MRYEYYSNVALVSSVVVYVLAMFAHAAEWAAARRLGPAEEGERELAKVSTSEQTHSEASSTRVEPLDNRPVGRRPELVDGRDPRVVQHHQCRAVGSARSPPASATPGVRVSPMSKAAMLFPTTATP